MRDFTPTCECCRRAPGGATYGMADHAGQVRHHHVCAPCSAGCSTDDDGGPVHMLPGWPGTAETFAAFVAPAGLGGARTPG